MKGVTSDKRIMNRNTNGMLRGFRCFVAFGLFAAMGVLQSGCASNPEQSENGADQEVAAQAANANPEQDMQQNAVKAEAEAKVESVQQDTAGQVQDADAMVASLARKEKYALVEEPAVTDVAKAAPVKERVTAKTVVEEKAKTVEKAAPPKAAPAPAVTKTQSQSVSTEAKPSKAAASQATEKQAKRKLVKKAINASEKDLPISLDMWSLGKDLDSSRLLLSTPTWQMGEGSYLSQVWLTIEERGLMVHSSSDIDPNAKGSGIALNGGERIPFSKIEAGNIAVFEGDWMNRLSDGGKLDIYLGFFPGKTPPSPTFNSDASLDALTRLVPTYQQLMN